MADKEVKDGAESATSTKTDNMTGSGAHDAEKAATPNVVDWDSVDDPQNPLNWPKAKKWSTISLVAYITFVTLVEFQLS